MSHFNDKKEAERLSAAEEEKKRSNEDSASPKTAPINERLLNSFR